MNKQQTEKNTQNKVWSIANVIGWLMLIQGFIMAQNSVIWILNGDDTYKWFLRAAMSMICFGFAGVILRK